MIDSQPFLRNTAWLLSPLLALFFISCGSYQQASYYDNDGIYADGSERVRVERYEQPPRRVVVKKEDNSNVYGNYFGQKADEYEDILESEIFTDIDDYAGTEQDSLELNAESDYYYDPDNTYQGYGGWGDNASSVTVNIYDNWGWGGYGFGLGYPWFYNSYWGWNSPYRWNRWGWGGYYGWGWNNWAWGWGGYYGYPGYWGGYYGYPGYWGGYYAYPYYRYGRGYYGYGSYAYNRSRRGLYNTSLASGNLRGRSNLRTPLKSTNNSRYRTNSGRSNLNSRPGYDRSTSKYRSNTSTRRSVGVDGIERNRSYRSSRSTRSAPQYNNRSRSGQTYRNAPRSGSYNRGNSTKQPHNKGTYSRSAPRRSSGYSRPSSPSRSSGYRSSGSRNSSRSSGYRSSSRGSSPNRSSGYRSSGSSSRSSGGVRSSAPSRPSSGTRSSGGGRRPPK